MSTPSDIGRAQEPISHTLQNVEEKLKEEHNGEHGHTIEDIRFDNSALRELPIDPIKENYVRRAVPNACFSLVTPQPIKNPVLVHYSPDVLHLLGINVKETERADFAKYFGGCVLPPGAQTAAHCYCGHQFGNFAGQLGDGRAMYMGEIVNDKGERWELQLKGAGKTPYSRDADGRAVLRSSIREFLCSEALHFLGIPSTRAGSLVTSDTLVTRDLLYSGNPIDEKASVVLRVAPTFIRFGSFQIANPTDEMTGRSGPSAGNTEILKTLANYVIKYHYKEIWDKYSTLEDRVVEFFGEIVRRTARTAALWHCVGWAHGVLNTDNMSILGITIDYGPFGFLDAYDEDFICNGSDHEGRYSFKNQPEMCKWNCGQLMESLLLFVPNEGARLAEKLAVYDSEYKTTYITQLRKKFGLFKELPEDQELVAKFFETMQATGADFTNVFRSLSRIGPNSSEGEYRSLLKYIEHQCIPAARLIAKSKPRTSDRELQMMVSLAQQNPMMLMMMGKSPEFLIEEIHRREKFEKIRNMTAESKAAADEEKWTAWLGLYKTRIAKDVEGVADLKTYAEKRTYVMDHNNPKFILRNYLAQIAIKKAEEGDFSEVKRLFDVLRDPYDEGKLFQEFTYDGLPPDWASDLCVTCSS